MQYSTHHSITNNATGISLVAASMALASIFLLSACSSQRENDLPDASSLDTVLLNAIDSNIIMGFSSLADTTSDLVNHAETFCNNVNTGNLNRLQHSWRSMSEKWNRVSMYNIGPLDDDLIFPTINFIESMRQRGIDYTDAVRTDITNRMADTTSLNSAYFNNLPFTDVGLLSLEVLVFEDTISFSTADTDIINEYAAPVTGTRKCDYLIGMTRLLDANVEKTLFGWREQFPGSDKAFRDILLDGELDDGAESIPALIATIQQHLDYVKRRKLDAILDAKIAGHFYQNILSMLDEIELLLEGEENQIAFFDFMSATGNSENIETVRSNIANARVAARDEDRTALSIAIGALDGNFKREIPESLDVEIGITFSDGD